jgi:SulP family sulfate permease
MNTDIQPRNTDEYINYVLLISMIGGAIQLLCGIFRLGFLVNFLSKPILSGFTTAAAILIALTQVKYLFGIKPESEVNPQIYWSLYYIGKAIFKPTYIGDDQGAHWPTMLCAVICFFFFLFFKFLPIPWKGKRYHIDDIFPSNLIVIIGGTILMTLISLSPKAKEPANHSSHDIFGIQILGHLDSRLPMPALPKFYKDYIYSNDTPANVTGMIMSGHWIPVGDPIMTWDIIFKALLVSVPCVLIGFAEAYSVGSFYAVQDNYTVDPNHELMAIGTSAFVGSFFSAYTASTSFSRSALNAAAGARSQLAGLLTGLLMIIMLLFVAQLFYYLPKPLLGAMIIMAIVKLIDFRMVIYTFRTKKKDFVSWMACFLCTLFVGLQWGILLATLLSLGFVIYRASRPRLVVLGKEPGGTNYQSIKRFSHSIRTPGVLVLRIDAELFFGNCSYVISSIKKCVDRSAQEYIINGNMRMSNKCKALVMDMGSVNQIDSTAVMCLKDIKKILDYKNIRWYLANCKPEVIREMQQGSFIANDMFDESNLFGNVHEAVRQAVEDIKRTDRI